MFSKSGNKMLQSPRDDDAMRIGGSKLNSITQIVSPKSGSSRDDHHIIHSGLNFSNRQPARIFFKKLICPYKLIKNPGIQPQQHSWFVLPVLKSKKPFRSGKQFDACYIFPDQFLKSFSVGFIIYSAVNKQFKIRKNFPYRLAGFFF